MADNIQLDLGSGGEVLATDDIASKHYQKILVGYGADGAWTRVTASAGFPIQLQTGHADIKITLDGETVVLGAGSAAFGKLAANSGIDIGDVDVTSIVPGTAASNLGKTEDTRHSSGDVGVMLLAVRKDTAAALAGSDEDYIPLTTNNKGQLWIKGDVDAAQSGTWIVSSITNALPAGNNNIGNVDIVTLPSGNLGQQAMAASLSVVPASDITDGTYIGDIKFGEAEPNSAAIKTALEIIDDWDESDRAKVNPIAGQVGIAANAGVMSALTTRITIATDDTHYGTVGAASDIDGVIHGQLRYIADQLVTIDSDTNDIKTAIEIMDDWDDGSDHCEVVGADAENANVTGKPVLVAGRYDSSERTTDTTDATTLATSAQGWMMVGNQSSYLFDGVTRCQVKRATGLAASGTVAMVAAVGSKKIRCLALFLKATSDTVTNVYIANDDNDILGDSSNPIPLAVDADGDNDSGFVLGWNPGGWFETDTVNEALNLIQSAAQDIIYAITYIEVA